MNVTVRRMVSMVTTSMTMRMMALVIMTMINRAVLIIRTSMNNDTVMILIILMLAPKDQGLTAHERIGA